MKAIEGELYKRNVKFFNDTFQIINSIKIQ